jgi:hypothetical protein
MKRPQGRKAKKGLMLNTAPSTPLQAASDREARLQALIEQLRPSAEQALRQMAERLVEQAAWADHTREGDNNRTPTRQGNEGSEANSAAIAVRADRTSTPRQNRGPITCGM